jgi:hypothetical protein
MRIVIAIPTIILNRHVHTDHAEGYALMHWIAVRCDEKNPQYVRLARGEIPGFPNIPGFLLEPKPVANLLSGTPLKNSTRSCHDEPRDRAAVVMTLCRFIAFAFPSVRAQG